MSSDPDTAPRHAHWLTANLISQLAFGLLAMTICLPSMQDWPAQFGASQAAVQLTLSAFIAAYGGLQLVWGPWSDRIGRKPLLLAGLVLSCAGSVFAALAPNLGLLTLARVVQGAGCAAGMVIARAMVQDLFTGNERTRVMAFVGMTMGVCPPLATLVGGQLHVRFGWRANFALMAVLAAVLLFTAWRGLPAAPPRPRAGGVRELLAGYGRLLREPAFLLYVVLLASTTATFYTFLGGAPIVLRNYGVTPERIGWYIMCIPLAYIVGNLWTSRLVRRTSDRRIMALGQAWTLGGLLGVLALGLGGASTPLALALPLLLLGIGHGLLAPPTLTGTVGLVPALAGAAAAIAGLIQQLSGAFGAFVVGLVPHDGQVNLALQMLAWACLGLTAQFVLHTRTRMARA
ncbi:multidrug effflux MFS transporter [Ramlibacter sp. USB13]|uniref:Bcr/CflA family efflux transporter n=1 Tax=Ramlibacter cellulosilyticus TaxID=2764187 RepID=A0A923SCV8_9BURK|nr:multidrug effflux MFS transporter [Ramlibacter cellulosilyticus]MBC5785381.1 multidrug effflux MFS transporter [Ramlibacter cellulosilyticus]